VGRTAEVAGRISTAAPGSRSEKATAEMPSIHFAAETLSQDGSLPYEPNEPRRTR
jgi:hypothetical protein